MRFVYLVALLLASCSYKAVDTKLPFQSLHIPPIHGDQYSHFRSALMKGCIQEFSLPSHSESPWLLRLESLNITEEYIDFCYEDPLSSEKRVSPSTTRLSASAKISIIEKISSRIIFAPQTLSVFIDFDHEAGLTHPSHQFSKGQLDLKNASQEKLIPVLAEKFAAAALRSILLSSSLNLPE